MVGLTVGIELYISGRRFGSAIPIAENIKKATKAEIDSFPQILITYEDAKLYHKMFESLISGYEDTLDKYDS